MKKDKILRTENINIALLILAGIFIMWLLPFTLPFTWSQTYNESAIVNTTVNITNAAPLVYSIDLDTPIDLVAYGSKVVYCNVSIFDYDNDTLRVNASLYLSGVAQPNDTTDNNNHYFNSSCTRVGLQHDGVPVNYSCAFSVQYYADNSSDWYCNVTVIDEGNVETSNISSSATINPLVAIKLPTLMDYGDLAVGDTSADTLSNITNAGNRDANISVKGYADTEGDGYAFNCSFGTIALSNERYDIYSGTTYSSMTQITSDFVNISNFYVAQRTSETQDSLNQTYWKVQIPIGAGGVCNGKIMFLAFDRNN